MCSRPAAVRSWCSRWSWGGSRVARSGRTSARSDGPVPAPSRGEGAGIRASRFGAGDPPSGDVDHDLAGNCGVQLWATVAPVEPVAPVEVVAATRATEAVVAV